MLPYFEALGGTLERAWSALDRDEESFSDVAVEALRVHPPHEVDREALIDLVLDPAGPVTRQLVPLGVFGQPGVTVFHGRSFVVDVYFWTHSQSAIHDHPFCGAFSVLEGFSVHARYRFEEAARPSERVRLGALTQVGLELVEPGTVHPFGRGRSALVHALLHVPVPSISMVVRTVRTDGYLRYFPPGLAVAMHPADDAFERPLALLDTLRAAGDPRYPERRDAFLRSADLETTFSCLSRLWLLAEDAERRALSEAARVRHGERVRALTAALDEARLTHEGDSLRAALRDPDDRLVATGLTLASGRGALLGLLAARHADPIARLHRFVDESGHFAPDEEASAHIAHALIDGEGVEGALRRLASVYGDEAIAEQEHEIRRYAAHGPFARLARE